MKWEIILPICISLAALVITALAFKRNETNDTAAHATEQATMSADIRYIRSSVDEIKLENRAIKKDLDAVKDRILVVEQSVASAHRRLDDALKG